MKIYLNIDRHWGQIFLIPTITITYDYTLNGNYELSFHWLKWIVSLQLGDDNNDTYNGLTEGKEKRNIKTDIPDEKQAPPPPSPRKPMLYPRYGWSSPEYVKKYFEMNKS